MRKKIWKEGVFSFIVILLAVIIMVLAFADFATITKVSPANESWTNNSIPTFTFNFTDDNITNDCTLWINNGSLYKDMNTSNVVNVTDTSVIPNATLVEGARNWYVNCTNGTQTNQSLTWELNVDLSNPVINLEYPSNNSNLTVSSLQLNYTPTDWNLSTCELYGNWTGSWHLNQTDTTPTNGTENNFTTINIADGTYIWNVWCNDSANNSVYNSTDFTFTIDTVRPVITIQSPLNQTYNTSTIGFNVSLSEEGFWCGFSLNGTSNITMTKFNNTYFNYTKTVADGFHNVTFSCNDTTGNENSTSVRYFTVDTTRPAITIQSPLNQTYVAGTTQIDFNVSLDEEGTWCGYSLNGSSNVTMTKFNITYFNYTKTALTIGSYNVTYYCNDTVNNLNSTSIRFTIAAAEDTPGGGGGGAGGGGSGTGEVKENCWDSLETGKTIVMELNDKEIGVEKITFTMKKDLLGAEEKCLEVVQIRNISISALSPYEKPENVYKYFVINPTGITNEDVRDIKIEISVADSWLKNYNEDTVTLNRYAITADVAVKKWNPLETEYLKQDSLYSYFESPSHGFSDFAITAEVIELVSEELCGDGICDPENGETQLNCCVDCGCPNGFECVNNACAEKKPGIHWAVWIIVGILALIIGYIIYSFVISRKRRF